MIKLKICTALDTSKFKEYIVKTRNFLVIKIFWPSELELLKYHEYYYFRKIVQNEVAYKGTKIINMLGDMLRKLSKEQHIRLHLIGHSTGTIVLAYSLTQCKDSVLVDTVVLIQSSISREEFKDIKVSLRQKVSGDILITYKESDEMLKLQDSLSFLNSSELKSIGRYGTCESDRDQDLSLPIEESQIFEQKKIYTLDADKIMQDHNDFKKDYIATPILKAIAIT